MNRLLVAAALVLASGPVLAADPAEGASTRQKGSGPSIPPPGSAERAAIMDGIRGGVVAELGQLVIFKVDHLRVQEGWAFLKAYPRRPDGGEIDYRRTKYAEAVREGMFDGGVQALLRRNGTRWEVVDWVLGATDVPYGGWWKKYRAPKAIFDYTEP